MTPFLRLSGIVAALPLANVDTDKILPGRFLKTISRSGLGSALFADLRFRSDGSERPEFALNIEPWRSATILVSGENFGCGSSREHAPWALADFGFRCIIAPSFADIFSNNCIKNGILPISLDYPLVELVTREALRAETARLEIDLASQTVTLTGGTRLAFEIDPRRKTILEQGIDDIERCLNHEDAIAAFENARRAGSFGPRAAIEAAVDRDFA